MRSSESKANASGRARSVKSALKSSWAEQLGVIRAWADSLAHTRKGLGLG